jgi:Lambda phage tail tape-measure protein (Tape_meas_lam_C)
VGFISTGKLELQSLADSILADLARTTVRQTITAPLAGALQSAFAGGGLFGLFHEGGIAGESPLAVRYADAAVFEHAPRYHGGAFVGSGLLPHEVPIIARRGELVVPPERVVREEKTAREQRPITVVVNVTAADANCSAPARARSRRTWRARSIGRAGTDDVKGMPVAPPTGSLPPPLREQRTRLLVERPGRGRLGSNPLV